jgi:hypothetical protein
LVFPQAAISSAATASDWRPDEYLLSADFLFIAISGSRMIAGPQGEIASLARFLEDLKAGVVTINFRSRFSLTLLV